MSARRIIRKEPTEQKNRWEITELREKKNLLSIVLVIGIINNGFSFKSLVFQIPPEKVF